MPFCQNIDDFCPYPPGNRICGLCDIWNYLKEEEDNLKNIFNEEEE